MQQLKDIFDIRVRSLAFTLLSRGEQVLFIWRRLWLVGLIGLVGLSYLALLGLGIGLSLNPNPGRWDKQLVAVWIQTATSGLALLGVVWALLYTRRQIELVSTPTMVTLELDRTLGAEHFRIVGRKRDMVAVWAKVKPGVGIVQEFTVTISLGHDTGATVWFKPLPLGEPPSQLKESKVYHPSATASTLELVYKEYRLAGRTSIWLGTIEVENSLVRDCFWYVSQSGLTAHGTWHPTWWFPEWTLPTFRRRRQ